MSNLLEAIWSEHEGTRIAEISTLQANGFSTKGMVQLPDKTMSDLRQWTPDMDASGEDIAGWKHTVNGQKYLIIND